MEEQALKILRKHTEDYYLFGLEVTSDELMNFHKSIVSAMEEYAELRMSKESDQSEEYCEPHCDNRYALNDGFSYCPDCGKELG